MTFITLIQAISLVILAISCITIYHNTNSYEPGKRIIYIIARNNHNVFNNSRNMHNGHKRNRNKKRTSTKWHNTSNETNIYPNKLNDSTKSAWKHIWKNQRQHTKYRKSGKTYSYNICSIHTNTYLRSKLYRRIYT